MKNSAVIDFNVREKIFASLILIALLAVYYHSVLIGGHSFMTTTARSYQLGHYHYPGTYWHVDRKQATADPVAANQINLPTAYLESHYIKTLQLPLWNPYSGLGRPYNADMNSYTFFVPIYIFKLFPSLVTYDLYLLFRLFISGFFMFLLLRLYRCQFWIAMAGASFYMLNSHFQAFVDMDHLSVTMFLSPMVYFLTKFLFSTSKRYLIGFILASAGSFFGGNPNEYILIHLFVILYFFFFVFAGKFLGSKYRFRLLFLLGTAIGASLLLSSIKLIPFLEFWKNAVSARFGGLTGTSVFLPLKGFLGWMLIPNKIGGGPNYVGYLILSLMFFSFFHLIRKRWRLRERIIGFHFILLFLLASKINAAPYINWIGSLSLFNNINYVKYCSLLYYMISVISAFSLAYLVEDVKDPVGRIKKLFVFLVSFLLPHLILWVVSRELVFQKADNGQILLLIFILFGLISVFLIGLNKPYKSRKAVNGALVLLIILAVFELRLNNHQYYRQRFKINDRAPYSQFLLEQKPPYRTMGINGTLMPNHNLVYPVATLNRIFAMRVKRPVLFLSKLISSKFNSGMSQIYYKNEILDNPYLDLLNVKYYISESIIDSIVIDSEFAAAHKIKGLIDNSSMSYIPLGNLYYYTHWGWQQLADSSVDIPLHLPYGDVYLKATALAFNFDWHRRESSRNRLDLKISVRYKEQEEAVYNGSFFACKKQHQDFFPLEVNLSKYGGHDVIINLTLRNPGARSNNDRAFFFGDLRVTYNKIKKITEATSWGQKPSGAAAFEKVPYEEVFAHHAFVYRNNRALERGFVLYDVKRVRDCNEAVEILKKDPSIYKRTALIEGKTPDRIKIGKKGQSKVTFFDYKANRIKIYVESTEDSVFILSDAYYPGWKAYVDQKQAKIYPAFGALRAVFLSKGKHELIFLYKPWTFTLGAFLTFVFLVFLGIIYFSRDDFFNEILSLG